MDEFAQSRDDDDLFGDEFEAIPTPTLVHDINGRSEPSSTRQRPAVPAVGDVSKNRTSADEGTRAGHTQNPTNAKEQGRAYQEVDRGRGRGRTGARGRGRGGLAGSRFATPSAPATEISSRQQVPDPKNTATANSNDIENDTKNSNKEEAITSNTTSTEPASQQSTPTVEPPIQPASHSQPQITRATAVRGDRSLTGGPQHTKLTEEELTAKLAKMAILNAEKSEKFRRTEADSAAFQQKEAEMKKKRAEELKNAREMDKERARNRERKLKAQGGREWDVEKLESDIVDGKGRGRTSEYVRGGHGGVINSGSAFGLGGSRYADGDELIGDANQNSRGRGGYDVRGRGNRGRGRGGRGGRAIPPPVPVDADFPALPAPTSKPPAPVNTAKMASTEKGKSEDLVTSPLDKGPHDWAEEMATPIEKKV